MGTKMLSPVKYTEHKEHFTLTYKRKSTKSVPRIIRISLTDKYATDSSGEENEGHRVKKYIKEVKIESPSRRTVTKKKAKQIDMKPGKRQQGKLEAEIEHPMKRVRSWSTQDDIPLFDIDFLDGLSDEDDPILSFFDDMPKDRVFSQDPFFGLDYRFGFRQSLYKVDDYLQFEDIGDLF